MQVKDLGVLYDEGVTVELPISPTQIGNYQVRIKTPSGKEKTKNIKITSLSDKFVIPNFNGQKKFEKGVNTFYLYYYNPDRQRMVIDGFQTWAVEFKERSSDDSSVLINQMLQRILILESQVLGMSTLYHLIGTQNGINNIFNLQHFPEPKSLKIYRNGVLLNADDDDDYVFNIDSNTITFLFPPEEDELLQAGYIIISNGPLSDSDDNFITDGNDSYIK